MEVAAGSTNGLGLPEVWDPRTQAAEDRPISGYITFSSSGEVVSPGEPLAAGMNDAIRARRVLDARDYDEVYAAGLDRQVAT